MKEAISIRTTPEDAHFNRDSGYELPNCWIATFKKLKGGASLSNARRREGCETRHATSSASHPTQPAMYKSTMMDRNVMDWFCNVKAGEKFRPGSQWRPIPRWLPLYQDKAGLPSASPKSMLNARGIDFADYGTGQEGTSPTDDNKKQLLRIKIT